MICCNIIVILFGFIVLSSASGLDLGVASNSTLIKNTSFVNNTLTNGSFTTEPRDFRTTFVYDEVECGRLRGLSFYMTAILTSEAIAKDETFQGPFEKTFRFDKYGDVSIDIANYSPSDNLSVVKLWTLLAIYEIVEQMTNENRMIGGYALITRGFEKLGMIMISKYNADERDVHEINGNETDSITTPATHQKRVLNESDFSNHRPKFNTIVVDDDSRNSNSSTLSQDTMLGLEFWIQLRNSPIPVGGFFRAIVLVFSLYGSLDLSRQVKLFSGSSAAEDVHIQVEPWINATTQRPENFKVSQLVKGLRKIAEYVVEQKRFEECQMVIEARLGVPVGEIRIARPNSTTWDRYREAGERNLTVRSIGNGLTLSTS